MNHFVKNILTKGWLNISAMTKGFILPFFKYEIIRKRGGGDTEGSKLASGYREENLIRDLRSLEEDDIEVIKVYVNWDKNAQKYDKKIYVELIKKKIEVKLVEQNLSKIRIDVELV